jgi:hypothetical protein
VPEAVPGGCENVLGIGGDGTVYPGHDIAFVERSLNFSV